MIQKSVVLWRFCPVGCFLLFPILELLTPKGSPKKVTFWVTPRLSFWCSHFFLNFAPDIWWRQWFWWCRDVGVCKAIVSFCKRIVNVGDQNGGNRRFKHISSPITLSVTNIDLTYLTESGTKFCCPISPKLGADFRLHYGAVMVRFGPIRIFGLIIKILGTLYGWFLGAVSDPK